ncbi:MAG: diguanylate cyclase, partial [Gammaproteobacteria bacterium]|nr:diguanylate cyclase [Gammaproteobacteria bacterium]
VRGEMLLSERGDVRGAQKTYCCNGAGNSKGFIEGNTLWLPTRGGVVAVDTKDIVKNPVPPNVVIESIHHDQQAWDTLHGKPPFELPAGARDLDFQFTALSLQEPRSVLIKYRLLGYDENWVLMDRVRERQASYTNLPPGEYRFEVSGTNNAGVWATKNAAVDFTIAPFYYETWWFRLLILALLLVLIYAGYRFQLHNLTAQRARLEKMVRRRTEELRLANNQLRDAVQTDALTGLHNRRYVQKQLPGDIAFYERNVAEPQHTKDRLVFALADIDHLRRINEDHGPHVGDAMLRQFGKLLGQYTRAGDYIVRWEGEKFLLVFRPMESGVFDRIAERMRTAVQNHEFNVEGSGSLHITASIGFMEMPLDPVKREPLQWEDYIELADHALYYVKSSGRNGWATLRPTDTTRKDTLVDEVRLHLRALVDNGDLKVDSNHGKEAPS